MASPELSTRRVFSLILLFVFMVSFAFAGSRSSVVSADFYIPENVSSTDEGSSDLDDTPIMAWVFWGVGALIVVIVVGFLYSFFKGRKKVIAPVKKAKKISKKAKRSSKRKK